MLHVEVVKDMAGAHYEKLLELESNIQSSQGRRRFASTECNCIQLYINQDVQWSVRCELPFFTHKHRLNFPSPLNTKGKCDFVL